MYYLGLLPGLHTTTYSGYKKNTDAWRVRKDFENCTQSQAISNTLLSAFSITMLRTYMGILCLISQWGTITELNLQGLIAQCWQKSHIAGLTPSSLNHIRQLFACVKLQTQGWLRSWCNFALWITHLSAGPWVSSNPGCGMGTCVPNIRQWQEVTRLNRPCRQILWVPKHMGKCCIQHKNSKDGINYSHHHQYNGKLDLRLPKFGHMWLWLFEK